MGVAENESESYTVAPRAGFLSSETSSRDGITNSAGFMQRWRPSQNTSGTTGTPFSIRATHLIGFAGAPNNANGDLSIQDDVLRFEKHGKPAVQVPIASIQNVSLGEQSRELGGVPVTLGKAATPFGGGRAVSLFAHKKYDTLALEYVDASGGLHGAVFRLDKGEGDVLKSHLGVQGAHVRSSEDASTKQNAAGGSNENQ